MNKIQTAGDNFKGGFFMPEIYYRETAQELALKLD